MLMDTIITSIVHTVCNYIDYQCTITVIRYIICMIRSASPVGEMDLILLLHNCDIYIYIYIY